MSDPTLPSIDEFLDGLLSTNVSELDQRFGTTHPTATLEVAWPLSLAPWSIAQMGGQYLKDHMGAVKSLVTAGRDLPKTSDGAKAILAVSTGANNSSNTDQVFNKGIFTNELNNVKADRLLRTVLIGWAIGNQVGIFGSDGGIGVAYDILNYNNKAPVIYGMGNIGLGLRANMGLLLGAFSRSPHDLNSPAAVFEFGASLLGIGVFFAVIMTLSNLDLIGFTLEVGVALGFSGTTGYGRISAG